MVASKATVGSRAKYVDVPCDMLTLNASPVDHRPSTAGLSGKEAVMADGKVSADRPLRRPARRPTARTSSSRNRMP